MIQALRAAANASGTAPFVIYSQEQENGQRVFKIRGPGCSEIYPWGTYDAALKEVEYLRSQRVAA
jgi:hypothetical protein